jgi:hypothetical protein
VEHLPGLAVRRRVVEGEEVESELGVRRAADVAEVALLEQGIVADRQAGGLSEPRRGLGGAGQVAGQDRADARLREASGQSLGLGDAPGGEGVVGTLDGAGGVAERLAVADQEDQITRSRRRAARSAAV